MAYRCSIIYGRSILLYFVRLLILIIENSFEMSSAEFDCIIPLEDNNVGPLAFTFILSYDIDSAE